ncbi:MAG: nucleoside-diphosphate kinase [Bowdeniella nasicola]|nr:nucleoside-diphosphate kinase [Bowdeniella nasicola]
MATERSLVLIKTDAVKRGQIGEVLRRIEAKGYRIVEMKMLQAERDTLAAHYAEHKEKPFFNDVLDYMSDGKIVALVIEGDRVVEGFRALAGSTDPTTAPAGTIRGDLARDWGNGNVENVVHGSDAVESANREIKIWFPNL